MNMRAGVVVLSLAFAVGSFAHECEGREENKALVLKAIEILNSHEYAELGTVLSEEFRRYCQATPDAVVESLDDFKALLARFDQEVPDGTIRTQMLISEGDLVAVWATYSGTQTGPMGGLPATGKHFEAEMGVFYRIANGKITESWVIWDNLAILSQLGLFPPPEASQPNASEESPD